MGCGDGTAAATAAPFSPATASSASTGPRTPCAGPAPDPVRRPGELTDGGLPFRTGSADAVLFSEVIEHLVDPDAALDEIRRVLRPGGHLMLSTPNLAAWYNRALLLAGVQPVFSEVSLRGIHGRPGGRSWGTCGSTPPARCGSSWPRPASRSYASRAPPSTAYRVRCAPWTGWPAPGRRSRRSCCCTHDGLRGRTPCGGEWPRP
ncbi:class I SAM-dependent methyltransferase [Streptomyces sp. MS1.AVA.1]|uniref:Class I SAM-dependent methyltransferase n=1 Tax=Streptomyces machairae TaxID=3134109 RepID=A0ABU8ULF7_9ACTN